MPGLLVLTPNPAVDVVYRVSPHRHGDTVRVLEVRRRAGGKGVNVAGVAGQLGCPAHCLLPLGGDPGAWVRRDLDERSITATVVTIAGQTRSTVTVVDGVGHPTVYAEPGPVVSADDLARIGADLRRLSHGADLVITAGSLPPGVPEDVLSSWVEEATAAGAPTLVDTSGPALRAAARAGATIVKANERELLDATGTPDLDAAAGELRELGADLVLVSLGAAGLVAYGRMGAIRVPAVPGVAGNPTGAGDAATAAFAAAYVARRPLSECLHRAAAAGAAAVLSPVAGEVRLEAYTAFLAQDPARWSTP